MVYVLSVVEICECKDWWVWLVCEGVVVDFVFFDFGFDLEFF